MHKHDIIRTTTGSGRTILVRYAKKINRVRENSASFPAHGYRGLCCSISNGSRILVTGLFHSSKLVLAAKR